MGADSVVGVGDAGLWAEVLRLRSEIQAHRRLDPIERAELAARLEAARGAIDLLRSERDAARADAHIAREALSACEERRAQLGAQVEDDPAGALRERARSQSLEAELRCALAFHEVAVRERDAARLQARSLELEMEALRASQAQELAAAEERGAWWAITELPHAGRPGMLPEDRAVAAVQMGRQRREIEQRAREGK